MKPGLKRFLVTIALSAISLPALAELVVVVNAKSSTGNLTQEQVSQIFLGNSTAFKPVDQADGSAIRNDFYKKVAGKEPSQVKAIWSKLVFTGKGKPPKEFPSGADVKKAIEADATSIGYIDKSEVDSSVKVVLSVP